MEEEKRFKELADKYQGGKTVFKITQFTRMIAQLDKELENLSKMWWKSFQRTYGAKAKKGAI